MSLGDLVVRGTVERGGFRLHVDTRASPGQVLGVLGPNGAGKTTLLRTLAGLRALSEGRIELAGSVLDDADSGRFVPPERRPVGLVFQNHLLFPHLSVLDNVAFGPRSRGLARAASRTAAREWLLRLGLDPLADRRPVQLSGGQAQQVALARALAAEPGLLLLDEPLSALDIRTRSTVRNRLREHLKAFEGPVLFVTHDPLEAVLVADRLLVIEDGRVVQDASPAEVARRPATQYVARLVGLNLYAGTFDPGTHRVELATGGSLTVAVAAAASDGEPDTRDVLVALRPSAVTVHTGRPVHSSSRNLWPGTIAALEPLADRVRAEVHGVPSALVDLTAAAVAELGLHVGGSVWLSAKATDTHAYPDPHVAPPPVGA